MIGGGQVDEAAHEMAPMLTGTSAVAAVTLCREWITAWMLAGETDGCNSGDRERRRGGSRRADARNHGRGRAAPARSRAGGFFQHCSGRRAMAASAIARRCTTTTMAEIDAARGARTQPDCTPMPHLLTADRADHGHDRLQAAAMAGPWHCGRRRPTSTLTVNT